MIKFCIVCDADRTHALVEDGARLACNGCQTRSRPAADPDLAAGTEPTLAPVDAQAEGRARMLGMWRAAVATVVEAARREAEERTAAIDPGPAPMPVLKEDKC